MIAEPQFVMSCQARNKASVPVLASQMRRKNRNRGRQSVLFRASNAKLPDGVLIACFFKRVEREARA